LGILKFMYLIFCLCDALILIVYLLSRSIEVFMWQLYFSKKAADGKSHNSISHKQWSGRKLTSYIAEEDGSSDGLCWSCLIKVGTQDMFWPHLISYCVWLLTSMNRNWWKLMSVVMSRDDQKILVTNFTVVCMECWGASALRYCVAFPLPIFIPPIAPQSSGVVQ
jgi:hypothetical protein